MGTHLGELVRAGVAAHEDPVTQFDVARQVRVFNAYLQYVEPIFDTAV